MSDHDGNDGREMTQARGEGRTAVPALARIGPVLRVVRAAQGRPTRRPWWLPLE